MKTVVITGASSGIGLVTGEFLSKKGYRVYGLSRTVGSGKGIQYIRCDITKKEEVQAAFKMIEGSVDAIINNAGIGISGPVEYTSSEDLNKILNVNLVGVVNVTQVAIPFLRKTKGRIINIGSVAGEIAIPFQAFYSFTKAGVQVLSEALNVELKPFGIKVTNVLPGDTKTSFTKNRQKNEIIDDLYKDRIVKSIQKMEKDEEQGMNPLRVSKAIEKVLRMKNPPLRITVGCSYKFLVFLKRFLPLKLVNYFVDKIYGGH